MYVSRIDLSTFPDSADNPSRRAGSHISNSRMHVHSRHPYSHLTPYPTQAEPFKTHRPNCTGAVQSNPFLAHRRGVQAYLSAQKSLAAPPT